MPKQSKQCLIIQVRPSNDILHRICADKMADKWRANILSTKCFTISMGIPLFCYIAYSLLSAFNSNSYIKLTLYETSHISAIIACLFQLFAFNC
eukprot:850973_1